MRAPTRRQEVTASVGHLAGLMALLLQALTLVSLGSLGSFAQARAADRAAPERVATRGQTVAILVNPALGDPLISRIEAELAAVGIRVRRLDLAAGADVEAAVSRAMSDGASAALRVIPRSRGTEVWTSDTTARVLRRRAIDARAPDAALSVLAFRTVEFLRATLLEVPKSRPAPASEPARAGEPQRADRTITVLPAPSVPSPSTPRPEPAARPVAEPAARPAPPRRPPPAHNDLHAESIREAEPEPPQAPARPPATPGRPATRGGPRLELQAGLALLFTDHRGGPGPFLLYALGARYRLGSGLAIGADGLIPVVASNVSSLGATTAVHIHRLELSVTLTVPLRSRFGLQTALGAGAVRVSTVGQVADPSLGEGRAPPPHWLPTATASVAPSLALRPWLLARLEVAVGFTTAPFAFEYSKPGAANTVVGGFGPLYGLTTLGLQAIW